MQEREMLELAAKAAGYQLDGLAARHVGQAVWPEDYLRLNDKGGHSVWNPLRDDGDALRLAVKLHMLVDADGEAYTVSTATPKGTGVHAYAKHKQDPDAATRRAIVQAAAELGKAMP